MIGRNLLDEAAQEELVQLVDALGGQAATLRLLVGRGVRISEGTLKKLLAYLPLPASGKLPRPHPNSKGRERRRELLPLLRAAHAEYQLSADELEAIIAHLDGPLSAARHFNLHPKTLSRYRRDPRIASWEFRAEAKQLAGAPQRSLRRPNPGYLRHRKEDSDE